MRKLPLLIASLLLAGAAQAQSGTATGYAQAGSESQALQRAESAAVENCHARGGRPTSAPTSKIVEWGVGADSDRIVMYGARATVACAR